MTQVVRSPKEYDVCIIGSGAGGGTAAKVLTEGGLNVVMLEAGPPLNPKKDFKEHVWPYQLAHRGAGVGGAGDEFMAPNGFWEIEGEPYTTAPGSNFRWFRSRIEGGRTNHWGRIALRFAPVDFKSRSTDGMGDDWPITYEDLAPYYDKVESYIGVFGSKENIPSAPDGMFSARAAPALHRNDSQEVPAISLNIICIPARLAIIDQTGEWARTLPLLRAMRTRMHQRIQFQLQPGDDSAGTGHRTIHPDSATPWPGRSLSIKTAERRQSPILTSPRARRCASMPKRLWWQRAPVNPRACCSIRVPLFFPMAWRTHQEWSAAI